MSHEEERVSVTEIIGQKGDYLLIRKGKIKPAIEAEVIKTLLEVGAAQIFREECEEEVTILDGVSVRKIS